MHTYGGEDIDFGKRAQMYGARIDWLDEPGVAMYHVWHPSSGASASRSPKAVAAITENRRIHTEDKTFARNRVGARYLPTDLPPLVSILFDASDADARCMQTLSSILGQTIQEIEILVTDHSLLDERDPRIKITEADVAPEGTFVATARPGEIWADDFLERLLDVWKPGVGLLSTSAAELLLDDAGTPVTPLRPVKSGAPCPRSTLVRTELVHSWPRATAPGWVETLRHVVAAAGADWVVRPEVLHATVRTLADEEASKSEQESCDSLLLGTMERCGIAVPKIPEPVSRGLGIRANAALYGRRIALHVETIGSSEITDSLGLVGDDSWESSMICTRAGAVLRREHLWTGTDLRYALRAESELKAMGAEVSMSYAENAPVLDSPTSPALLLARAGEEAYGDRHRDSLWLAVCVRDHDFETTQQKLMTKPSVTVVLDRVVVGPDGSTLWLLARCRDNGLSTAWKTASALTSHGSVFVVEVPAERKAAEETQ
ncbi:hypothetical protein [Brachybacterium sp. Z12]|uniref:hypothetical protein n=1 Tax=Brachybacterium sp. Z12 TaxID=2759167 RepID=UPI00223BF593|nr:hypothetical protein [Brachybacterium sp. Z12]